MKLSNITIKIVPFKELRFTTAGDWRQNEDGSIEIWLMETLEWRYWVIVLMHELTEIFICQHLGIKSKDCDDFDARWEEELKTNNQDPTKEAGFDKRCPYRRGHIWGARMEWVFSHLLGVNWEQYCKYWDNFFKNI